MFQIGKELGELRTRIEKLEELQPGRGRARTEDELTIALVHTVN